MTLREIIEERIQELKAEADRAAMVTYPSSGVSLLERRLAAARLGEAVNGYVLLQDILAKADGIAGGSAE